VGRSLWVICVAEWPSNADQKNSSMDLTLLSTTTGLPREDSQMPVPFSADGLANWIHLKFQRLAMSWKLIVVSMLCHQWRLGKDVSSLVSDKICSDVNKVIHFEKNEKTNDGNSRSGMLCPSCHQQTKNSNGTFDVLVVPSLLSAAFVITLLPLDIDHLLSHIFGTVPTFWHRIKIFYFSQISRLKPTIPVKCPCTFYCEVLL